MYNVFNQKTLFEIKGSYYKTNHDLFPDLTKSFFSAKHYHVTFSIHDNHAFKTVLICGSFASSKRLVGVTGKPHFQFFRYEDMLDNQTEQQCLHHFCNVIFLCLC